MNTPGSNKGDMPAFPALLKAGDLAVTEGGITVRDYFIAHAPAEPQPWFDPVPPTARPEPSRARRVDSDAPVNYLEIAEYDDEMRRQRYIQWPAAWADAMLDAATAPSNAKIVRNVAIDLFTAMKKLNADFPSRRIMSPEAVAHIADVLCVQP